MRVNLYEELSKSSKVRVQLSDDFIQQLRERCTEKYGSVKKFCREEGFKYSTYLQYLQPESNPHNRNPPFKTALLISNLLGINLTKKDILGFFVNHQNLLKLPKFLEISELFVEGYGLYVAEGAKTGNKVALSNTNPNLLLLFIKWIEECFGVNKSEIRAYIYSPNESYNKRKLIQKWSRLLKLNKRQFRGTYHYKDSKKECCMLNLNYIVIKILIDSLREKVRKLISNDKKLSAAYIRGILAGDGHVETNRKKNVHHVEIGLKDRREITYLRRILSSLGIDSSIRGKEFLKLTISRKENIKRLIRLGGFGCNKERNAQLKRALSLFKQNQVGRGKALEFYFSKIPEGGVTVKELMEKTNKSKTQVRRVLNRLIKKKRIKRLKSGRSYIYKPR